MKNEHISIETLYRILRYFYVERFPTKIQVNIQVYADLKSTYTSLIIDHCNGQLPHPIKIELINGKYELTGDMIKEYIKTDPPKDTVAHSIVELSNKETLNRFISDATQDLGDLDSWLKTEGFVKEGVASIKLFETTTWKWDT